jgi:hypothetical protein
MLKLKKRYISRLVYSMLLTCAISGHISAQTSSQNYVRTREPRRAINTDTKLDQLTTNKDSVMVSIQYVDGLGRALQSVQRQASPLAKDIV